MLDVLNPFILWPIGVALGGLLFFEIAKHGIVTSGKKRLPSPHCRLAKPLNLLNPSLAVRQVVSSKNG